MIFLPNQIITYKKNMRFKITQNLSNKLPKVYLNSEWRRNGLSSLESSFSWTEHNENWKKIFENTSRCFLWKNTCRRIGRNIARAWCKQQLFTFR